MQKVNWFDGNKEFTMRMKSYAGRYLFVQEIRACYNGELAKSLKATVASLDASHEERIEAARKLRDLEAEYKERCQDSRAQWAWDGLDKDFYKSFKSENQETRRAAIVSWFKAWKLDVSGDTRLINELMLTLAGRSKASCKTIIQSDLQTWINGYRSQSDILHLLYRFCVQELAACGLFKQDDIPEILRSKYAKKPSKKTTKKAESVKVSRTDSAANMPALCEHAVPEKDGDDICKHPVSAKIA